MYSEVTPYNTATVTAIMNTLSEFTFVKQHLKQQIFDHSVLMQNLS